MTETEEFYDVSPFAGVREFRVGLNWYRFERDGGWWRVSVREPRESGFMHTGHIQCDSGEPRALWAAYVGDT